MRCDAMRCGGKGRGVSQRGTFYFQENQSEWMNDGDAPVIHHADTRNVKRRRRCTGESRGQWYRRERNHTGFNDWVQPSPPARAKQRLEDA